MPQDKQGNQVSVAQAGDQFDITYPETGQRAGFIQFLDHEDERIFYHTEVDEKFGGRGLAGVLVGEALTATTAAGLSIVGVCPFVKGYLAKTGHDGAHRSPRPADLTILNQQLEG